MGLSVNTNTAAMNAYRNLSKSNSAMNTSLERLSSGYRINRAADDAAGLAISEGLRSQIGGLTQAVSNTQDGTSVVQTAEGALDETTSILQRMRDLSVQASNDGSLNDDAKASIQKEVTQLKSELTRISDTTNFNGTKLLDGSYTNKSFQVGANSGETIKVSIGGAMGTTGLGLEGVDVTGKGTQASTATPAADASTAGTVVLTGAGSSASIQGLKGAITANGKSLDLSTVDYSNADADADGTISDDEAKDALNTAAVAAGLVTSDQVTAGAGFSTDGTDLTFTGTTPASGDAADLAKASPSFTNTTGASDAIDAIDKAIKQVSAQRADLGAIQNRFEHTINNLNTAIKNTTWSESRIRDTDMASEMTKYTSNQVLIQAGTAMLAQANQSTQSILKLLQG